MVGETWQGLEIRVLSVSHCLCRPSKHLFTKHLLFHLHFLPPPAPFIRNHVVLVALGLRRCSWAFSSCGRRDYSCNAQVSYCSGSSCCGVQAPGHSGSGTSARRLSSRSVQLQRRGLQRLRGTWDLPDPGTCVPCTGRQIPTYPVAWEVPTASPLKSQTRESACHNKRSCLLQ